AAGGGTFTHIEWMFGVTIDQSWPVLVVSDLSQAPLSSDQRLSPIQFVERSSRHTQTAEVAYKKQMLLSTPYSGNYANLHELTTAQGEINKVTISGLTPSIFGEGYEVVLDINYRLHVDRRKTALTVEGENAHSDEKVTTNERLRMHFYP